MVIQRFSTMTDSSQNDQRSRTRGLRVLKLLHFVAEVFNLAFLRQQLFLKRRGDVIFN